MTSYAIAKALSQYKDQVDDELKIRLTNLGSEGPLRDACEYAILSGGKRYRPAVVLMVAKALKGSVNVMDAALAAEFFHAASLIADDLPCMDNDDERRNKPSVHKVFGESVALLASYSLIAAGYQALFRCGQTLTKAGFEDGATRCCMAGENISDNLGIEGAAGGQYMDLFPPNLEEVTLKEVLHKKTVTLFESSFLMGWLYGGGDIQAFEKVKALANHFGIAFQIADDLGDIDQDAENDRDVNYAAVLGKAKALDSVKQEVQAYFSGLEELNIASDELVALGEGLLLRAKMRA